MQDQNVGEEEKLILNRILGRKWIKLEENVRIEIQ